MISVCAVKTNFVGYLIAVALFELGLGVALLLLVCFLCFFCFEFGVLTKTKLTAKSVIPACF
jgi:hypothetical protein